MTTDNTKATDRKESSTKHARGSKQVHSEKDNSTKDGYKPNKTKKQ
ncbi:hypothetical protein M0G43_12585 [Subsaxibacter sp. CAU 1640]|nr:hypothetical protein [Subsaxibacter sp. CAU 1640]MCK7591415.1 hypothetical protein [Subsaxibacter sp. CAU 1640]